MSLEFLNPQVSKNYFVTCTSFGWAQWNLAWRQALACSRYFGKLRSSFSIFFESDIWHTFVRARRNLEALRIWPLDIYSPNLVNFGPRVLSYVLCADMQQSFTGALFLHFVTSSLCQRTWTEQWERLEMSESYCCDVSSFRHRELFCQEPVFNIHRIRIISQTTTTTHPRREYYDLKYVGKCVEHSAKILTSKESHTGSHVNSGIVAVKVYWLTISLGSQASCFKSSIDC